MVSVIYMLIYVCVSICLWHENFIKPAPKTVMKIESCPYLKFVNNGQPG